MMLMMLMMLMMMMNKKRKTLEACRWSGAYVLPELLQEASSWSAD
jgi:hypothetical protein